MGSPLREKRKDLKSSGLESAAPGIHLFSLLLLQVALYSTTPPRRGLNFCACLYELQRELYIYVLQSSSAFGTDALELVAALLLDVAAYTVETVTTSPVTFVAVGSCWRELLQRA